MIFIHGSAVVVNEDEICLFGVNGTNNSFGLYKYSITENEYSADRVLIGNNSSNAIINNYAYLLEDDASINFISQIVSKYSIKNNTLYQYDKRINYIDDSKITILQIVNANNDLYLLTDSKLYKAKIVADYKDDGIYVISQETSIYKDLDISNILDVKKIVDGEEQDILVYIGDGASWKLLHGSNTTQTTNALQYALSFKEES